MNSYQTSLEITLTMEGLKLIVSIGSIQRNNILVTAYMQVFEIITKSKSNNYNYELRICHFFPIYL